MGLFEHAKKADKKNGHSIKLFKNLNTSPLSTGVDKGLVAMFLRMSPEERLIANDNTVRAILELRNAYQQQKINRRGSKDKLKLPVLEETLRQLEKK